MLPATTFDAPVSPPRMTAEFKDAVARVRIAEVRSTRRPFVTT